MNVNSYIENNERETTEKEKITKHKLRQIERPKNVTEQKNENYWIPY